MDEREKQEQKMVTGAYFACAAVGIAGCAVLALIIALLSGFRFSADSAAGGKWKAMDTLEMGNYTIYYTLAETDEMAVGTFAAVKKSGIFYCRSDRGGQLVYPVGSDVPAGQLYSYEDTEGWHHVLLLNMVLPQGTDRRVDTLVVRGEELEVALNSCFSTPRQFSEFILDGVTFEVRAN